MFKVLSIEILRVLVLLIYLLFISFIDIKKRYLSMNSIFLGFVMMSLFYLFSPFNILSLIGGILIGLLVIGISIITNQAVGLGDGLILIIIGLCFGANTVYIFFNSLILLSITTVLYMLIKHKRYNIEVPMIPFYLVGVMIQIFI